MDITTQFSDCLTAKGTKPIEPFVFNLSALNEFLIEAYNINSHISELIIYLRSIRPSYLSLQSHNHRGAKRHDATSQLPKGDKSQPLSDTQKTRIDSETRQLLTTISGAIRQLSETAKLSRDLDESVAQQKRSKRGLGALGRWAAGGIGAVSKSPEELEEDDKRDTIKQHRDGVLWFLENRLKSAGEMQRSMVEIRVRREVEKSRSILYKARGPGTMGLVDGIGISNGTASTSTLSAVDLDTEEQSTMKREAMESLLSPEQIQLFEREQQDMLRHYNSELNKIRTAESSLLEISSLQTELAANLEVQSESISQLVADSEFSRENVQLGNKNLKKASEKRSKAQMTFWATVFLCAFLTGWDLVF